MADSRITDLFSAYSEDVLIIDDDCKAEIINIVNESGLHVRFGKDYEARMKILLSYRENAGLHTPQWFEHLKHTDSAMYSMHLANIGNMRILYIIGHRIIFLCAFKEKQGQGRKRQSYVQYIPIAEKRLERYKEV